jgi:hypothetical protein
MKVERHEHELQIILPKANACAEPGLATPPRMRDNTSLNTKSARDYFVWGGRRARPHQTDQAYLELILRL